MIFVQKVSSKPEGAAAVAMGVAAVTLLLVIITRVVVAAAAANADAFQTAVACVQTVWPQRGPLSCDLLTRRICTPATNSHGLLLLLLALLLLSGSQMWSAAVIVVILLLLGRW
jgi:hypothetical protein